MKPGIRHYILFLFLFLALSSVTLWTVSLYQHHQNQQVQDYLQQLQIWQSQIKSAQSEQLLWLQSRFYDIRSGVQQRLDPTLRERYINEYSNNVSELKLIQLYSNTPSEGSPEQSDCENLAKSLFAETEKGAPPLFFSCLHDQQAMMGVKGDFRIYSQPMGLVLLMDYFSFIKQFEQFSGKTMSLDVEASRHDFVYTDSSTSENDLLHEISFNRDQVALGRLQLHLPQISFLQSWLTDAYWMIPLLLLFTLLFYRLCYSAMIGPLYQLSERMKSVVTAQLPGNSNDDNKLAPGLRLLQRYFMHLTHMAKNDPLTGLHNRVIFEERMEQALIEGKRSARKYAIVFIDIDDFHRINKKKGHYIGDDLLRQLAKRLSGGLRESDTLARLEEDNFALLLEYSREGEVRSLLEKIHKSLAEEYRVYGRDIKVDISIGVSLYPDHAQEVQDLMLLADKALLQSQQGKGDVVMIEASAEKMDLSGFSRMQSFRQALENDEFKLVYQPVVDLSTHATSYFEALLRWKKPEADQLSIPQIIALAESNNSIRPLTRWIIESACAQLKQYDKSCMKIAINLSMIDFHDDQLPQQIGAALQRFDIAPHKLMIEITEGHIMQDQEQVISILNQLSAMGISLSIDDFGTGQASLTYLKKLPVEKLKIDQSFVRDMVSNKDDRTIVEATINLAQTLGIKVVAEGVESTAIHDLLLQMGCDFVQGYYISKPMDAEQLPAWCDAECS